MPGTVIQACSPFKGDKEMTEKKEWHAPNVTVYGDVQQLTLKQPPKLKQPGLGDDFRVPGVSDA